MIKLYRYYLQLKFIILTGIILLTVSCIAGKEEEREKVAKVYDKILYKDDLDELIPENIPSEELERVKEEIISNWINQNIVLYHAEKELPESQKMIERQIEKYRTSLLMYEYEKQLAIRYLDTTLNYNEIKTYYENNIDDFVLDDYLVKVIFIKSWSQAPELENVYGWYKSNDTIKLEKLNQWCLDNAMDFYNDNESWLYFNDIQKMLPQGMIQNKDYFVRNNMSISFETDEFVYFLRILDNKTGISPIDIEEEKIRSRILQVRIAELRQKLREEIVNDAYKNNKVTRF